SSGTDVQLVLSQNTTIHYSPDGTPSEQDLAVAAFFSGSLEPGQCMTQQLEATAQVPQEGVWYLGAVADPANAVPELIETNNTRASQLLGIGSQADLIVQAVSAPNSAAPEGGSLEVTVTVCNQGTTGANAYAEFYLSQDKAISILDTQVGWASLGMLGPGQCTSARRPSSLYVAEGDWYLGAIAHTISEPEFSTENNARTGAVVRVGYAPDFLIQSVSAPPGVVPGAPFTASVRVCNQGTESGSTDVQLVLSGDATIRFSPELPPGEQDLPLASFSAGPLSPGECQTQEVELSLQPSRLGTWYLGAVADSANAVPEFFEDNNTRASKPVGIGSKADFIIQAVSGPPSVLPGALFTAEVTVCNQGTSGGSADVVVLLSEDTSIRFSGEAPSDDQDQPLASFSAGRLEPGQCATQQVQASVQPSLEGAWYLGAVADPAKAVPELFENNNTLASEPMGIGSGPDFVLQALDSPRGVRPGGMLSAEFTLCNQGTQSGGTDVQLLLSADTTVSASSNGSSPQDLLLTSVSTGLLAPGQCVTRQAQAVAPSQLEGSWYLGLVADPANTTLELLETNNTRVSQSVFIGYQARFVVQALSHQRSVVAGGQLRVDLTVCNQGTAYGTPQAAIVLSRDREFFPSDTVLAPVYLSGLSAGECHSGFLFPAASAPEGLWYLGAAVFHEYVPENLHDVRFGDTVAIGTQPDFVIQAVSGPVSALPGQPFTASVKVCNQGTVSGGTEVQLVLSSNGTAAHQDLPLASFSTGELLPGRCMTQQVETQVLPPHEGAWYLGAVADPSSSTPEFLETNNTRVSAPVGIGQRPDFIVQTVSGPASLLSGAPLRAEVTVCNQGTVGGSTDVQLVASRDTTIRFSSGSAVPDPDLPLTAFSTGVLEPGQCATQQVQASAQVPHEGAWYLGAVADPGSSTPELLEANNSQASAPVGIGHQPDFIVQSVSAPPSAEPWQQFTVAVTVCNQGTLGGDTDVQVVLSRDTTLAFASASLPPAHDVLLSTFATGLLEPGQCTTRQVQTRVVYDAGDGVFYLGAIANPGYSQPELVVSNNARVGGLIGIGRAADLFIPSMSGPASATSGAPFTAEVTVCNQGTNGARARVYLVLSEDTDIHYGPYERPEDNDVLLGFFPTDVIMPGQCSTLPGQVSAQVPHNGLWYLGAVVNADWGDLIVSNNTASAGAIQIHE
ncbi:CARDB domain-containing protein, partial [Hyalangium sp.]|uniref:CARDB domain-containing protein n=1 Tax=Hyalangium sp. TaxID=2028555 RepID=UPI002D49641C